MNENEFRELIQSGLGRAILYAREHDVRAFREVVLDACLHCYSVDGQSEGTRAGYMLELVNLMPDRQFYCDKVLESLAANQDDWDAVQRFHFATYMAFDGDERARQLVYENFEPGPKMGEHIAVDFVRLDGLQGLLFAAAKIGALLKSIPDEVDEGWLWTQAIEMCGEQEARAALVAAGASDSNIEAYRLKAIDETSSHDGSFQELQTLSYEQLRPRMSALRAFDLRCWCRHASDGDIERAAHGFLAAQTAEEQRQHLRIFSRRQYPLDPAPLLDLSLSADESMAFAASVALSLITHPGIRDVAFRLVDGRRGGRDNAIAMLAENWKQNDHETVLRWFVNEPDRHVRHRMELDLRDCWEPHPEPATEPRMLRLVYERGPCSFCRELAVQRLIELNALSASMQAECSYDANDEIRRLVEPLSSQSDPT